MKQLYLLLFLPFLLINCSTKEHPIPEPVADFTFTVSKSAVLFNNKSTNADSYLWDFGNGESSKQSNPTVTYSRNGSYQVKLVATSKSGESNKIATVVITDVPLTTTPTSPTNTGPTSPTTTNPVTNPTLIDVVDNKSLAARLPGTWGVYVKGQEMKFNNYSYTFSASSNKLVYRNYYNNYYTLLDPETRTIEYKFSIKDNIIYTELSSIKEKYARIEMVSDEEMKMYWITETSSSYSESLALNLVKTSDIERNAADVIKTTKLPSLTGIWGQGVYSIYTDVYFDFSAGKNFYQYGETFQGSRSIVKNEFRIDENDILYYRRWNSDFDPSWKKYKMVVTSQDEIELRPINNSGIVSSTATYKLKRRR